MNKKGKRRQRVFLTVMTALVASCGITSYAFEEETSKETIDSEWTEVYTYLSDSEESHKNFLPVQKDGTLYEVSDIQYEVTPLTSELSKQSGDLWAYATYEPEQELEESGLHYMLSELTKEEWTQNERFQTVTQYQSYIEGQEIPESIEVASSDEITQDTINGTIWRTDLWEDGAAWQEGGLEQWIVYSWSDEAWTLNVDGEVFYATEESPWFDGCEQILLKYLHLDEAFNQITSVEWDGDSWQNEDGSWGRTAHITGNRMAKRYQAVYSGDLPENDLPMVRYTAHYTSDPWQYLISANVTYKRKENTEDSFNQKIQDTDQLDEKMQEINQVSQKLTQQLESKFSQWEEQNSSEKSWYLLLAVLAAVSVGLQVALIFVLAMHRR